MLSSTIFEDHSGLLWIGTADGLNSFDRNTGQFTRYQHDPANSNSISRHLPETGPVIRLLKTRKEAYGSQPDMGLNKLNKERTAFTTLSFQIPNDPILV